MLEKYFNKKYLSGDNLVGDDFSEDKIEQWYKEEEEAYCNLTDSTITNSYLYENINNFYGFIDLDINSFDLITSFGVLHHIPNVSYILSEFNKILKKDGFIFLREPISSMGDWSQKRVGMTINERGISSAYLVKTLNRLDCEIIFKKYCLFSPILKIFNKFKLGLDSCIVIYVDFIFSKLFSWNVHYFRNNTFKKFAPGSVFILCQKK